MAPAPRKGDGVVVPGGEEVDVKVEGVAAGILGCGAGDAGEVCSG